MLPDGGSVHSVLVCYLMVVVHIVCVCVLPDGGSAHSVFVCYLLVVVHIVCLCVT